MRCKNDGQCVPTCDNSPEDGFFSCLCSEEWEGEICAVKVSIYKSYFLLFRWYNCGESTCASIVEDLAITFKLAYK